MSKQRPIGGGLGVTSVRIPNLYQEVLDKRFLDQPRDFKSRGLMHCELLQRWLYYSGTGGGKTNAAVACFLAYGGSATFDSVTVCSKTLDEPLYRFLMDYCRTEKEAGRLRWARFCSDLDDVPTLDNPTDVEPYCYEHERELNHWLCVDDQVCSGKDKLQRLDDFWMRGRKFGITSALLVQSWTKSPIFLRSNSEYIVLGRFIPPRSVTERIAGDVSMINGKRFGELYAEAVRGGDMNVFLLVDRSTASAGTPWMFRRCLDKPLRP